jgi:hypothetical protein
MCHSHQLIAYDRFSGGTAATAAAVGPVVWDMLQLWCQLGLVVGSMLLGE